MECELLRKVASCLCGRLHTVVEPVHYKPYLKFFDREVEGKAVGKPRQSLVKVRLLFRLNAKYMELAQRSVLFAN